MPLTPVILPPGQVKNGTDFETRGRWRDGNLIRWFRGAIRPVGGWTAINATISVDGILGVSMALIDGAVRKMMDWNTNDGQKYMAIGSGSKLYAFDGGVLHEIQPTDLTGGSDTTTGGLGYGADLFGRDRDINEDGASPNYGEPREGSAIVVPLAYWHYDTFGENLLASINSDGRLLQWVPGAFRAIPVAAYICTKAKETLTLAGNAADTETVKLGLKTYTFQTVLTDVDGNVLIGAAATDSIDNLIAAITLTGTPGTDYANSMTINTLATATAGPGDTLDAEALLCGLAGNTIAIAETLATGGSEWAAGALLLSGGIKDGGTVPVRIISFMTTSERHVMIAGYSVDNGGGSFTSKARSIRWSTAEDLKDWKTEATNTVGGFDLETKGIIVTCQRFQKHYLVWTDLDLHRINYIGQPFIYNRVQAGAKCGCLSANSVVVTSDQVVWISAKGFFIYDGNAARRLDSDVADFVLDDIDFTQKLKISGSHNSEFNEFWWFYPSVANIGGNFDCDSYVVWNHKDGWWATGRLQRSAFIDAGLFGFPIAIRSFDTSKPQARLTATANPANTETVTLGTKTYTFQTVLTNVDGNVLIGATASDSLDNLIAAIILGAGSGTKYAAATVLNPDAIAVAEIGDVMKATSKLVTTNPVSTETLANGSWSSVTLIGGNDGTGPYSGKLYQHEDGFAMDGGEIRFLESAPLDIAEGNRNLQIDRFFQDTGAVLNKINIRFKVRRAPNAVETTVGPFTLNEIRGYTDIRGVNHRQAKIRIEEIAVGNWNLGRIRLNAEAGSKR